MPSSTHLDKQSRTNVNCATFFTGCSTCHQWPAHSVQRNAQHLLPFFLPHIILTQEEAVITGDSVSTAVPKQECKQPKRSSKNPQLRTFLECPNEPSLLCLQFQTDGNPAICPPSVSLSGLLRGHAEE